MCVREKLEPIFITLAFACLIVAVSSCESFLEVEVPDSKITNDLVFSDDAMATAAVAGIYLDIYRIGGFASGGQLGLSTFAGLSADELTNNSHNDPLYLEFEMNSIDPNSPYLLGLWASMYSAIYQSNAVIQGLENTEHVSLPLKKELTGEVLFIRALCYFYLTNTFGDVPLVISTDYTINATLGKVSPQVIYDQIKSDLISAEEMLSDSYPSFGRVRPNKSTAMALLSRVYLYTEDWARAEDRATKIISNRAQYSLLRNLDKVFLESSTEAIWQIKPADNAFYTNEGYIFSVIQGPQFNVLNGDLISLYEPGDKRKTNWVTEISSDEKVIFLPYKYKKYDLESPTNEYSMVFRLAEIYLIRSEARLRQDKITGAISDLDSIRNRAGLPMIGLSNANISKDSLWQCLIKERKIELMVEWGHRWYDLKRLGIALQELSSSKLEITRDDLLYPIPQKEINNNRNLNPQNLGY